MFNLPELNSEGKYIQIIDRYDDFIKVSFWSLTGKVERKVKFHDYEKEVGFYEFYINRNYLFSLGKSAVGIWGLHDGKMKYSIPYPSKPASSDVIFQIISVVDSRLVMCIGRDLLLVEFLG